MYDLVNVLFYQFVLPWFNDKYEKRIKRIFALVSLIESEEEAKEFFNRLINCRHIEERYDVIPSNIETFTDIEPYYTPINSFTIIDIKNEIIQQLRILVKISKSPGHVFEGINNALNRLSPRIENSYNQVKYNNDLNKLFQLLESLIN